MEFVKRHISTTQTQQEKMLAELGYPSGEDLLREAVPPSIQIDQALKLGDAMSEHDALAAIRELADQNQVYESLIGMGWYDTITPAVLRRNLVENPAWYTAYTPYQPEISQGRLELLLTFQEMVADLTGCEIANASMLDEATAAAEAMTMLARVSRSKLTKFFVDEGAHPQTIAVIETRAEPLGIEVAIGDPETDLVADEVYGVLLATPTTTGEIRDIGPITKRCHDAGALVAAVTDLLACTLITPPGEQGVDVVVGSAQRFGVPMGFGGPHAGFMATRESYARSLPGRLVGVSVDANGNTAFRLALQTREQHIRREKATSNICTSQVLLANLAAAYGAWHGPDGLRNIATQIHSLTSRLAARLNSAGLETNATFFDTVTVRVPGQARSILERACQDKINLRLVDDDRVGISLGESATADLVDRLVSVFVPGQPAVDAPTVGEEDGAAIPAGLKRTSRYMTHPNFLRHQSEHEMLRWLRQLSDRDLALDRTMIPLGSCTMKLNAAAEMEPISWPQFASIHPFAPESQTRGYLHLIEELEQALAEITGYHSVSIQPNAGSQGEYAGLLAIRRYLSDIGQGHRHICLIPSSAHGTNAASAVMAGMRVVVVECDDSGNIDMESLTAKIAEHQTDLAALMITYPSTHGVYEETVSEVCRLVHEAGGQVYTDGANLNALVGVAKPGLFGSDVSHLNLHKTFCIPHGGGGPGVGPIGVAEHLAPYLPGHPVANHDPSRTGGVVSAAPFGSAGILPISWMYLKMMGAEGLVRATEAAVLAANYVAHKLKDYYPVLYTGANGLVAHECIIDIRPLTASTGITNDDIAKRLADYGFHAPTMSFPVAGTLMIEPTESESVRELDRFCDAMIAIRAEIDEVANGQVDVGECVLRNAPHTAEVLTTDEWDRPYSRRQAAYPVQDLGPNKYFPPVGRVDNAWGDRNLSCSCPSVDHYR